MLFQRFHELLKQLNVTEKDNKIIVAVSGGVDSIVLLHLLMRLKTSARPQLVIAHINHQLRAESEKEASFVKGLAAAYELPFYIYEWPKTEQPASGIEEAARNMRYRFFKKVMDTTDANILMTGHHQDDQVETILMKLARGSSLDQLTGIALQQPFNNGKLIRPLLYFSKDSIYQYAHHHQLGYEEDLTNQELTYSRNRFRNEIIPRFKEENAQFNEHIEQFSKDLDDLLEIAEEPIQDTYQQLSKIEEKQISFKQAEYQKLPEPMQRAFLNKLLLEIYPENTAGYKTSYITLIQDWIIQGEVNTVLELTENRQVKKTYTDIIFYIYEEIKPEPIQNKRYELNQLDEWLYVAENEKFRLREYTPSSDPMEEPADCLLIGEDELEMPLTIRHRQPGDRMAYQGLKGTKKIKDIFIDEKVPPKKRDEAWVVEDAEGRICWLVGYRKMRLFAAEETDKLSYVLEYKKE